MADSANPMAAVSASMLSSIPADMLGEFNAAADLPDPAPDTFEPAAEDPAPADDGTIETAAPETEQADVETQAAEPEAEELPAETKPPVAETKPGEELPDGVVAGKNRKGEEGVFVDKKRWDETIYANHKMVREVSELIGEPATMEAISLRDKALRTQENMYVDLESGDPATQAKVVDHLLDTMIEAKNLGRSAGDPSATFATTFVDRLQSKSPEAYAAVRGKNARDLLSEVYQEAARAGNKDLMNSAAQMSCWLAQIPATSDLATIRATAQRLGVPFHTPEEMEGLSRGADPMTQLRLENQRLHEQVNGRTSTNQAAQYDSWKGDTDKSIAQSVIDEAVKPALKSIEEAWKPFQKDYDELVVKRLQDRVDTALRNDPNLNSQMRTLLTQAKRAVNPQVREQIAAQITRIYSNRAKLAAEANRREVIDFANQSLKGRVDSTHGRRQAAQTRTAPQGTSSPVPRSLVPPAVLKAQPGEVFDPSTAYKKAMQLLG